MSKAVRQHRAEEGVDNEDRRNDLLVSPATKGDVSSECIQRETAPPAA